MTSNSQNQVVLFLLKTVVTIVLALVGAWALELNTVVSGHTKSLSDIQQQYVVLQTEMELLLHAHGIQPPTVKNGK